MIASIQADGGPGSVYGAESGPSGQLDYYGSGDTSWIDLGAWAQPPMVDVACGDSQTDVPVTVTFYARPTAPVSFSGASTYTGAINSNLPFIAPVGGSYRAVVTLSQGAIKFSAGGATVSATASGTYPLGIFSPGEDATVKLNASPGSQAEWSMTIEPTPVTISGVSVANGTYADPDSDEIKYAVNGGAALTATIVSSSGNTVRTLVSGSAITQGAHTMQWNGVMSSGEPAPAGRYTVRLRSVDSTGNVSTASRAFTIAPLVLGLHGAFPNPGAGFGAQRPKTVAFSGTPSEFYIGVKWQHWGSDDARGMGSGSCKPLSVSSRSETVHCGIRLEARNLGLCKGHLAYRSLTVFANYGMGWRQLFAKNEPICSRAGLRDPSRATVVRASG